MEQTWKTCSTDALRLVILERLGECHLEACAFVAKHMATQAAMVSLLLGKRTSLLAPVSVTARTIDDIGILVGDGMYIRLTRSENLV
jgi:hypothetical protein